MLTKARLYKIGGICTGRLTLIVVFALVIWVTGCAQKIEKIAEDHTVYYGSPVLPNPDAEFVLEYMFSTSEVPWDKESLAVITECRRSLVGIAKYMKERLDINGEVPYYSYKESADFTNYIYTKLQRELDARAAIDGALPLEGEVLYSYVKRDILERLERQRLRISQEEDYINKKASKEALDELKGVYNALQPLIGGLL